MAKHWHYQLFGEEFGPVSEDVIRNLMAQGTLASDDPVRHKGGAWTPIHAALSPATASVGTAVIHEPPDETDDSDDVEDWYCQILGQELGPLSFNDLLRFAEGGELSADDQLRLGIDGKWRRVGSMGRLVAVLPYVPAPPTKQSKSSIDVVQVQEKPATPAPKAAPAVATPAPVAKPAVVTISLNEIPEATHLSWFAWIRGVEYGPSSLLQLQQWIQTGQLSGTDFVKYGPTGQWCPSSTVNEILDQLKTVAAAKAHAIPAPSAPVTKSVAATPATPAVKPSNPTVATVAAAAVKAPSAPEVKAVEKPAVAKVEQAPVAPPPEPKPAPPAPTPVSSTSSYGGSSASNWQAPVAKVPPKPVAKPRASSSGGSSIDFSAMMSKLDAKTLGVGGGAIAAVALVFVFMYMPAGNGLEAQAFKQLHPLFVEFQKVREKKGSDAEVQAIATKVEKICPPLVVALDKRAGVSRPASQKLLWVAKYRMKEMLVKGIATRTAEEVQCEQLLYDAAQALKLPMDAPKPVETATPKGKAAKVLDVGS